MKLKMLAGVALVIFSGYSFACTKMTNSFNNGVYTARTMDLCADLPYDIAVYPRGMKESGEISGNKTMNWNSKYASVMVREIVLPVKANVDGVNEKGLAINLLYLGDTQYEKRDVNRAGISIYKWAKYALDNYATVSDVLKSLDKYQIVTEPVKLGKGTVKLPLHFSVEDTTGDNAVIEFLNGKVTVFHNKKYAVMANEPSYDKQLVNLAMAKKGSNYSLENLPGGARSMNRFVRASFYSENLPKTTTSDLDSLENMFSAISGTFVPYYAGYQQNCGLTGSSAAADVWPTQWATVLDQTRHILYLIDGKSGNHMSVSLNKFNVKTGQPVRVIQPQSIKTTTDISDKFIVENY